MIAHTEGVYLHCTVCGYVPIVKIPDRAIDNPNACLYGVLRWRQIWPSISGIHCKHFVFPLAFCIFRQGNENKSPARFFSQPLSSFIVRIDWKKTHPWIETLQMTVVIRSWTTDWYFFSRLLSQIFKGFLEKNVEWESFWSHCQILWRRNEWYDLISISTAKEENRRKYLGECGIMHGLLIVWIMMIVHSPDSRHILICSLGVTVLSTHSVILQHLCLHLLTCSHRLDENKHLNKYKRADTWNARDALHHRHHHHQQ